MLAHRPDLVRIRLVAIRTTLPELQDIPIRRIPIREVHAQRTRSTSGCQNVRPEHHGPILAGIIRAGKALPPRSTAWDGIALLQHHLHAVVDWGRKLSGNTGIRGEGRTPTVFVLRLAVHWRDIHAEVLAVDRVGDEDLTEAEVRQAPVPSLGRRTVAVVTTRIKTILLVATFSSERGNGAYTSIAAPATNLPPTTPMHLFGAALGWMLTYCPGPWS